MSMPLAQWDYEVRKHLDLIECGADMALSHARQLQVRPGFETRAEATLQRADQALEDALATIRRALATYRDKAIDT